MSLDFLPELQLGSDALMDFLKSGLQQLEQISGEEDEEARRLLQMLQQQAVLMQAVSGDAAGASAMTDIEIAHQIDSLDAQLSNLEASLGNADASTMQLLGQSTSKWLVDFQGADEPAMQPSNQQPRAGTDQEVLANTTAQTAEAKQGSNVSSSSDGSTQAEGGHAAGESEAASNTNSSSDSSNEIGSAEQPHAAQHVGNSESALQECTAAAQSPRAHH